MGVTLVTGASGFVGTYLLKEMRERGLAVRGVSRSKAAATLTIPSYGPELDWTPYLEDVDTVVHLAARVHVMRETATNPLAEFRRANVDATLHLARQSAAAGVRRFVFVSTIKVNGERTEPGKPFTADDQPNPQDPYAVSKAEAEAALTTLGHETGMEIVIIRPPLVYGPGVGGNFKSLMKWASFGLPSICEDVKNRRSLVFVGNLCDLIITTLSHPNAAGRVLLACDGPALSTHELLVSLAAAFGKKARSVRVRADVLRVASALIGRKEAFRRLLDNLEVDDRTTRQCLSWRPPYTEGPALAVTGSPAAHRFASSAPVE